MCYYLPGEEKYLYVLVVSASLSATWLVVETALLDPVQSNTIVVKENGRIKITQVAQVHYLEPADDNIKIDTADSIFKQKTMQYFEESLPKQEFIRIHRSHIANTQLIIRISCRKKKSIQYS